MKVMNSRKHQIKTRPPLSGSCRTSKRRSLFISRVDFVCFIFFLYLNSTSNITIYNDPSYEKVNKQKWLVWLNSVKYSLMSDIGHKKTINVLYGKFINLMSIDVIKSDMFK